MNLGIKFNRERDRRDILIRSATRYAWWLGNNSYYVRTGLSRLGWRLSRLGYIFLRRPRGALTWPLGLAFLTLNANNQTTVKNLAWVIKCFSGFLDATGRKLLPHESIDVGGIGYAALRIYEITGQERYLYFAEKMAQAFVAMPGAKEGLISYSMNRSEVLVDTVAFLCPFLARLSRLTGDASYLYVALNQLESTWKHSYALDSWVYHGFDKRDMTLLGINGWGRGVGWLLIGVIDTALELDTGVERDIWLGRARALLEKLRDAQLDCGHFPSRFDLHCVEIDSSVTSLVAYSIARLVQFDLLTNVSLIDTLKRCRDAINASTNESGNVVDCSGEALGVGIYSKRFGSYIWGQAMTVATDNILEDIYL